MSKSDSNVDKTLHSNIAFEGIEAYKQIRASLSFLITNDESKNCRVVGISSSIRGEGKSTTAINLAYVLAESGKKVILIDADMRLPSVEKKLGVKSKNGLSNILSTSEISKIGVIKSPVIENWDILTAGDIPPNPSELIRSNHFKKLIDAISDAYDYCIIDLPPVNVVSDTIDALPCLDGIALVVRERYTNRGELAECIRKLETVNAHIFGFIVNDTKNNDSNHHLYKRKRSYKYKSYK